MSVQRELKGISTNALFPRLRRQRRARILRYDLYTAVLRAVLPCTHETMTIFRGALNTLAADGRLSGRRCAVFDGVAADFLVVAV